MIHIVLDCDDVLLDWIGGFRSYVQSEHRLRPVEAGPTNWSLARWLGVPDVRAREMVERFNASEKFGQLRAVPGAVEAVQALHRAGHMLTVLTSCSADPAVTSARKANLQREFGSVFDRVICMGLGECKSTWLRVLRTGIWVEDNYRNALAGYDAGFKSIMIRRSHNRNDEPGSHASIEWHDDMTRLVSLFG